MRASDQQDQQGCKAGVVDVTQQHSHNNIVCCVKIAATCGGGEIEITNATAELSKLGLFVCEDTVQVYCTWAQCGHSVTPPRK